MILLQKKSYKYSVHETTSKFQHKRRTDKVFSVNRIDFLSKSDIHRIVRDCYQTENSTGTFCTTNSNTIDYYANVSQNKIQYN